MMPFVTQVTFVRKGKLRVRMKAQEDKSPYLLQLAADQAVLTGPGTFLQLINDDDETCGVLYIVSPAYLFEMSDGVVTYDDSIVLDEDWDELRASGWHLSREVPTEKQRREAEHRLLGRGK